MADNIFCDEVSVYVELGVACVREVRVVSPTCIRLVWADNEALSADSDSFPSLAQAFVVAKITHLSHTQCLVMVAL